jgi:hypothetical protein
MSEFSGLQNGYSRHPNSLFLRDSLWSFFSSTGARDRHATIESADLSGQPFEWYHIQKGTRAVTVVIHLPRRTMHALVGWYHKDKDHHVVRPTVGDVIFIIIAIMLT